MLASNYNTGMIIFLISLLDNNDTVLTQYIQERVCVFLHLHLVI